VDKTYVADQLTEEERSLFVGEVHVMKVPAAYIHALEGRLRIKVLEVKGSPANAWHVEPRLAAMDGINQVTANPRTGNVLVLYDSCRTSQHEIVEVLQSWGYLQSDGIERAPARGGVGIFPDSLANTLVRSSVEFALQRLITALI